MASQKATPGLLYVTMQPKETLPLNQFHDWYNNEHGPTRLRLPFIPNGFRYRATDLPSENAGSQTQPEWMACYDITDMVELTKEPYLRLRGPPAKSDREIDTMRQIFVDRMLLDFIGEKVNQSEYVELEAPENFDKNAQGNTLVAVSLLVDAGLKSTVDKWYEETEIPRIEKVSGWRRSRRYVTSSIEPRKDGKIQYLTIHEFAPSTDLKKIDISKDAPFEISEAKIRTYSLCYTFGAAPRHLSSICAWKSPDGITRTFPTTHTDFGSVIQSYVTTPDGAQLQYRLEGNSHPEAPLIVLSNSVLVTWAIWDDFVKSFFSHEENRKFRILRYMTRGRTDSYGTIPVTVDVLASDIIHLLNTLRVPKAAAVVGVSLGGATALATALTHPTRVDRFISCDTSAKSPAGNREAWGQRIAVAEKEAATAKLVSAFGDESPSAEPQPIVGEELAELTVRRWFVPQSYEDSEIRTKIAVVKHMVKTNSLPGFKRGVEALYAYDYTGLMGAHAGKGAFVVGSGDGALPKSMEAMAQTLGKTGGTFKVIDTAGHLPMVEKPVDVADFVTEFLK